MPRLVLARSCAALALLAAAPAAAQSIDYGSLETLFGEPVTTSATGKPQRASEAPANLTIITADDIRRSGLNSIPDILARLSGLDLLRWGAASADVSVRGYNQGASPRLLVLVNGRQVYSDHYAYTIWSTIPVQLSEIRQIEVVKGPNAALFGFNAVSGVINIVTFNPLHDDAGEASVAVGTDNLRNASISKSLKLSENVGLRLSSGVRFEDEFNSGNVRRLERRIVEQDPQSKSVAGALSMQVTPDVYAQLEGTHSFARLAEFLPTNSYNADSYRASSLKADVATNTDVGLLNVSAYRNWLKVDFRQGAIDPSYRSNVVTTLVQTSLLSKVAANHAIRVSAEYRHNEMDVVEVRRGKIAYDVYAVGGMWDWQIDSDLSLVNAVRLDNFVLDLKGSPAFPLSTSAYEREDWEVSYNGGLVWKATNADTLRLTASRGIQTPSLIELGFSGFNGNIPLSGDPQIQSSVITNIEMGYDRSFKFADGRASLGAALFWQQTENVKSTPGLPSSFALGPPAVRRVNGIPVIQFLNIGDSEAVGGELDVEARFDSGWTLAASYSHVAIEDSFITTNLRFIDRRFFAFPTRFENATPEHSLRGNIGYAAGQWSADMFLTWQSERTMLRDNSGIYTEGLFEVTVDDAWTATASVAYALTEAISLRGTVVNLFGDTTLTPGLTNEQRAFMTVSAKF